MGEKIFWRKNFLNWMGGSGQNTHFVFYPIKIGQELLKLSWGQIWDTGYSVQINEDPPPLK